MRYIIEAALLQSELLNRTLVLPSFVYARSCEWEMYVVRHSAFGPLTDKRLTRRNACAAFATMVNRGDAIGWGEWRDLPIEKQMGWRIPMEDMLDIPHLRKTHNVLLMSEYLQLVGIDPQREWSNGAWHRTDYLGGPEHEKLTIHVIPNNEYDPADVFRVDSRAALLEKGLKPGTDTGKVALKLFAALASKSSGNVLEWGEVKMAVADFVKDIKDDKETEALLEANGWAVLHTYAGA